MASTLRRDYCPLGEGQGVALNTPASWTSCVSSATDRAGPVTAYIYDWNILPIGQMLALQHLETYIDYPPMQAPASWNLSQVMEEINAQKRAHATKPAGSGH